MSLPLLGEIRPKRARRAIFSRQLRLVHQCPALSQIGRQLFFRTPLPSLAPVPNSFPLVGRKGRKEPPKRPGIQIVDEAANRHELAQIRRSEEAAAKAAREKEAAEEVARAQREQLARRETQRRKRAHERARTLLAFGSEAQRAGEEEDVRRGKASDQRIERPHYAPSLDESRSARDALHAREVEQLKELAEERARSAIAMKELELERELRRLESENAEREKKRALEEAERERERN